MEERDLVQGHFIGLADDVLSSLLELRFKDLTSILHVVSISFLPSFLNWCLASSLPPSALLLGNDMLDSRFWKCIGKIILYVEV